MWPQGFTWTAGTKYTGDIPWVGGYPSPIGSSVGTASAMSINTWVSQE
jgi:hypothetical protein